MNRLVQNQITYLTGLLMSISYTYVQNIVIACISWSCLYSNDNHYKITMSARLNLTFPP